MNELKMKMLGPEVRETLDYLDSVVDDDHFEMVNVGFRRIMMTGICLGGALGAGLTTLFMLILIRMV